MLQLRLCLDWVHTNLEWGIKVHKNNKYILLNWFYLLFESFSRYETKRKAFWVKWYLSITSPAPRNRKVCSAKLPPTSFREAISPARTTDVVPCNGEKSSQLGKVFLKIYIKKCTYNCWGSNIKTCVTWISSLKTRWVLLYFASSSNALWFAKSSNWKIWKSALEKNHEEQNGKLGNQNH